MLSLLWNSAGAEGKGKNGAENEPGEAVKRPNLVPQLNLHRLNVKAEPRKDEEPDEPDEPRMSHHEEPRHTMPKEGSRDSVPKGEHRKGASSKAEIGGIHASLKVANNKAGQVLEIDKVWPGGPAAKSKMVKSGDYLLEVNGHDVFGKSVVDAQNLIIGPTGTSVTLTMQQTGKKYPHKVTLVREPKPLQTPAVTRAAAGRSKSPAKTSDFEKAKADLLRPLPGLGASRDSLEKEANKNEIEPDVRDRNSRSVQGKISNSVHRNDAMEDLEGAGKVTREGEGFKSPPKRKAKEKTPASGARDTKKKGEGRKKEKAAARKDSDARARGEGNGRAANEEEREEAGLRAPTDARPVSTSPRVPLPSTRRSNAEIGRHAGPLNQEVGDAHPVQAGEAYRHASLHSAEPGQQHVRLAYLEGQVRRLQGQLEAKKRAHKKEQGLVMDLECTILKLSRRAVETASVGGSFGDKEMPGDELQQLRKEVRVCKAAAERSGKDAERERAIRLLLEDDLNVLKDSAKAHIPEHLTQRMAHLEAELKREWRARGEAEMRVETITGSMMGEIEDMAAARAYAADEVKTSRIREALVMQQLQFEEARRAQAEQLLRNMAETSADAQSKVVLEEVRRLQAQVREAQEQLEAQRSDGEAHRRAAEEEMGHVLSQVETLKLRLDETEEQLERTQEQLEEEALARHRAQDALSKLRSAVIVQQKQQFGGDEVMRVLESEQQQLEVDLEKALAEARETEWARLDLEEEVKRLQADTHNRAVQLASRVQLLEAQVAAQRVREEEAMERERTALVRAEAAEEIMRRGEDEMRRSLQEEVRAVREEERARQHRLEAEVERLRIQAQALGTPRDAGRHVAQASAFELLPRHTQVEEGALAPRGARPIDGYFTPRSHSGREPADEETETWATMTDTGIDDDEGDKVERMQVHLRRLEMDLEMSYVRRDTLEQRLNDLLAARDEGDPQHSRNHGVYRQELDDLRAQRRRLEDAAVQLQQDLDKAHEGKDSLAQQVKKLAARLVEESRARAKAESASKGASSSSRREQGDSASEADEVAELQEELEVALEDLAAEKEESERTFSRLESSERKRLEVERANADLQEQVQKLQLGFDLACEKQLRVEAECKAMEQELQERDGDLSEAQERLALLEKRDTPRELLARDNEKDTQIQALQRRFEEECDRVKHKAAAYRRLAMVVEGLHEPMESKITQIEYALQALDALLRSRSLRQMESGTDSTPPGKPGGGLATDRQHNIDEHAKLVEDHSNLVQLVDALREENHRLQELLGEENRRVKDLEDVKSAAHARLVEDHRNLMQEAEALRKEVHRLQDLENEKSVVMNMANAKLAAANEALQLSARGGGPSALFPPAMHLSKENAKDSGLQGQLAGVQEALEDSQRRVASLEAELAGVNDMQKRLLGGSRGPGEVVQQLQQLLAVKCRAEAAKDVRMKHALEDRDLAIARADRAELLLRMHEGILQDNVTRITGRIRAGQEEESVEKN
jgi:hypothetical protein